MAQRKWHVSLNNPDLGQRDSEFDVDADWFDDTAGDPQFVDFHRRIDDDDVRVLRVPAKQVQQIRLIEPDPTA